MNVTYQLKGVGPLHLNIRAINRQWDKEMDKVLKQHAENIFQSMKEYCPKKTGTLVNSITLDKTNPKEWKIKITAPYAAAVEWGHRGFFLPRQDITTSSGRTYRRHQGVPVMVDKKRGTFRWIKYVPPEPPAGFIRRAIDKHRYDYRLLGKQAMKNFIKWGRQNI